MLLKEEINACYVTRGTRQRVPNIIANEVWRIWRKKADPLRNPVSFVRLSQHRLLEHTQSIVFIKENVSAVFRTAAITEEDLVIVCLDGEATMLLLEEAESIFGENLYSVNECTDGIGEFLNSILSNILEG